MLSHTSPVRCSSTLIPSLICSKIERVGAFAKCDGRACIAGVRRRAQQTASQGPLGACARADRQGGAHLVKGRRAAQKNVHDHAHAPQVARRVVAFFAVPRLQYLRKRRAREVLRTERASGRSAPGSGLAGPRRRARAHLRSEILGRAAEGRRDLLLAHELGEPKVSDLDRGRGGRRARRARRAGALEQDVLWLEVTVHDVLAVQVLQRL